MNDNKIYLGIDFHKNTSTLCFLEAGGDPKGKLETIQTALLCKYLSNKKNLIIGIEASGGVNHYAMLLREQGHEVKIINPNLFRGIGVGGKKTDDRDARALAQALRNECAPEVYLKSLNARRKKSLIVSREEAVNHRTGLICHIRSTLREYGVGIPTGRENFEEQVGKLIEVFEYPPIKIVLQKKLERCRQLNEEIILIEAQLAHVFSGDEGVHRLQSMPGIGPMSAYMLRILGEEISRFKNAKEFSSYLGLVPSVHSSANKRHMGSITRSGSELARRYLIHGARAAMNYAPDGDKSLTWAKAVEGRRGKNKATVALANRLARTAFAMMRDQTEYSGRKKKKYKPRPIDKNLAA
jgi:transposase